MDAKKIGERIYMLIKEKNLTAKELSTKTGIKESALSSYKKGEYAPSAEAIIKLSEFFDVTTDWILTGTGEMQRGDSDLHKNVAYRSLQLTLSKEQIELLKHFDKLDSDAQMKLIGRVELLAEQAEVERAIPERKSFSEILFSTEQSPKDDYKSAPERKKILY